MYLLFRYVLLSCLFIFSGSEAKTLSFKVNDFTVNMTDTPHPTYSFAKDKLGIYEFSFLGLAEASGDPLMIKDGTALFLDSKWQMTDRVPTEQGDKITFSHNATGHSNSFASLRLVFDFFYLTKNDNIDPDAIQLTIWLETYTWVSGPEGYLVYLVNFNNSHDGLIAMSRPDRLQSYYGYLSTGPFAQSFLSNNSWIQRVPVSIVAQSKADSGGIWFSYEKFRQTTLVHTLTIGLGLESRPKLGTVVALTVTGIVVISVVVVVLVIFGRRFAKKYGHKYDTM
eukprot:TRINITY_DN1950_c0_g1_i7.p1 TRINITY_DN1950_c0_g1~~TRINITY_DN1950_c0_g1_i7.p1  ORF type:complete len:282 (-),score=30.87 TRINITY_DN1950_c0_g1_i7:45-890(-)